LQAVPAKCGRNEIVSAPMTQLATRIIVSALRRQLKWAVWNISVGFVQLDESARWDIDG
jgi:hypothetical protein